MLCFAWMVRGEGFFGHVTRELAQLHRDGSRRINVQMTLKKIAAAKLVGHHRVIEDAVHGIPQNCQRRKQKFREANRYGDRAASRPEPAFVEASPRKRVLQLAAASPVFPAQPCFPEISCM